MRMPVGLGSHSHRSFTPPLPSNPISHQMSQREFVASDAVFFLQPLNAQNIYIIQYLHGKKMNHSSMFIFNSTA